MKINFFGIIRSHLNTLYVSEKNRISYIDLFLFYTLPIFIALSVWFFNVKLSKDFYNISITFYGIFIALLLNIEVAIFGIFLRKRNSGVSDDNISSNKFQLRNKLIAEVDSNISYLVLVCIFSLIVFLFIFTVLSQSDSENNSIFSSFSTFCYVHFCMTLLMVVKRAHALFQQEYKED